MISKIPMSKRRIIPHISGAFNPYINKEFGLRHDDPPFHSRVSIQYNAAMPPPASNISHQIFWLFILAIPIATIARTVVFEEVFREARDYCKDRSTTCRTILARKFFYLFTCEYCFSHWVTLFFLILTGFRLLLDDWRGYIISWFALVFVSNAYLNLYARLRVDIASEKKSIEAKERQIHKLEAEIAEISNASVPGSDGEVESASRLP